MSKVTVTLAPDEAEALVKLALVELRTPRDQARYLLRMELAERGLLQQSAEIASGDGEKGARIPRCVGVHQSSEEGGNSDPADFGGLTPTRSPEGATGGER